MEPWKDSKSNSEIQEGCISTSLPSVQPQKASASAPISSSTELSPMLFASSQPSSASAAVTVSMYPPLLPKGIVSSNECVAGIAGSASPTTLSSGSYCDQRYSQGAAEASMVQRMIFPRDVVASSSPMPPSLPPVPMTVPSSSKNLAIEAHNATIAAHQAMQRAVEEERNLLLAARAVRDGRFAQQYAALSIAKGGDDCSHSRRGLETALMPPRQPPRPDHQNDAQPTKMAGSADDVASTIDIYPSQEHNRGGGHHLYHQRVHHDEEDDSLVGDFAELDRLFEAEESGSGGGGSSASEGDQAAGIGIPKNIISGSPSATEACQQGAVDGTPGSLSFHNNNEKDIRLRRKTLSCEDNKLGQKADPKKTKKRRAKKRHDYKSVVGGGVQKRPTVGNKRKSPPPATLPSTSSAAGDYHQDSSPSPLEHLSAILSERGYPTQLRHSSMENGYYRVPSPLQRASFGTRLTRAIHTSDVKLLSSLLRSGLSPNPCNSFGDSILGIVCKRGHHGMLRCMVVDHGATVSIADDFGRTPLHYAAWAAVPCFASVELLLDRDMNLLFVSDRHGATPLEYVARDRWSDWIKFLDRKKDIYWPAGTAKTTGRGLGVAAANKTDRREGGHGYNLIKKDDELGAQNTLRDPKHALPIDLARQVANGTMEPEEAMKRNPRGSKNNIKRKTLASRMA